ncbi:cytochrome o ubiquinol oxidase subunit IV [Teichococcus oryzae]|uniref:Cytochrome bo(3) ubiquinol oxidase subunit 4 n=1 Tax=Teichococcus oryzae TaxID=1608942 RepID=A0A5B2THC6_9PROT|nr:cytochrome o ubiquinol oxidase subunit IV [Pseudoroseomonas oryzae]KAA2213395.1 cytochrome o ubiquinol oxidase subunit IV [Pseudoroseomonas oryzae]
MATASRHPARPGPDPSAAQAAQAHGSAASYRKGFILALVLTVIPFALVMGEFLPRTATVAIVLGAAVVQMVVHLIYFLHLKTGEGERWNLVALVFTAIVVGIVMAGSIWVMHNMNYYMMVPMPMPAH